MACGHAKFTGEVGVCMATSGPGAIHLLNGLYDAKLDHQPVVAIVGQQARTALGGSYQQEVDLVSLFKDVAHEYVEMAIAPRADPAPDRSRRADRAGRADRDLRDRPERPRRTPRRSRRRRTRTARFTRQSATRAPRIVPSDDELRRAAEILNAGERVAMLVGQGALGADRRGRRDGRAPRRRRRQGAARARGPARRPALRHRLDRPARHPAELGADDRLRHAADGRLELPVLRVPARGRAGARRADRHRSRG